MESCEGIGKRIGEFAAMPGAEIPGPAREHLAVCPACTRELKASRLIRGLLAAAADGPESPAGFAERVLAALPGAPAARLPDPDLWRVGWKLVPAFAATAGLLLVLYLASGVPGPNGMAPAEGLSAGERLVLEAFPPEPDLVLTAVMEGGGT